MIFDDKHVKIHGGIVVWEGIKVPEQGQNGELKRNLKIVVNPNCPDLQDMENLANNTLQFSKFRGVLPAGGRMPIGRATADEFNGMFPGWVVLSCNTQRMPDVYDENGQKLDPMQYSPMLFTGQQVDVLVHCYEYDNKNKGIATGLDAFSIIVSANAQQLHFGNSGISTEGAFGGQPQPQGGQPQQQQQFGGQPQPQGGQPQPQQPQQYGGQPQQAQDFLPQQ